MFCRDHAVQLHRATEQFVSRGIGLVVIGAGSPAAASAYRETLGLSYPVYVSPDVSAYRAFGLGNASAASLLNPGLAKAGIRAIKNGARSSFPREHKAQSPGSFVIDREGVVLFAHPGSHTGDLATPEELIAAVPAGRA